MGEQPDTSSAEMPGSSTILENNAQDMAMSSYRTLSPEKQTLSSPGKSDTPAYHDPALSSKSQSSRLSSENNLVSSSTPINTR